MKSINKKVWVTAAFLSVFFIIGMTGIIVSNAAGAFSPVGWYGLDERQRQTVSGNGGPAVMVGNWLYFVGGHVDTSTIRYRQNEHNRVTHGAIYRVYIDPTLGHPLYEDAENALNIPGFVPHLLDESVINRDIDRRSRNFQIVVPKVAGFDQAALWVFDNHLIYTSPNNSKDRFGQLQLGKIDFFRVDLDGRNHRRIYTTREEMVTTNDFTVGSFGGEVFLLIKDGDMLRRVNVSRNPGRVTTISSEVQQVAFPIVTSYRSSFAQREDGTWYLECGGRNDVLANYLGVMGHIYYTEVLTETGQRGNRLVQYNVRNGDTIEVSINTYSFNLMSLSNGRLMYSVHDIEHDRARGLFVAETTITNSNRTLFVDTALQDGFGTQVFRRLVDGPFFDYNSVHMPTSVTPGVVLSYVALSSGNTLSIYRGDQREPINLNSLINDVSQVLLIDEGRVHFMTTAGEIRAVNLHDGSAVPNMSSINPETDIRPWIVKRNGSIWHFHVQTFTANRDEDNDDDHDFQNDSTTVAMISNLSGDRRDFILARLDCRFLNNAAVTDDECC